MKKLLGFLLIGLITSMAIISCKDDFNEEEFLKLQSDLKLKQDSINRARNQTALDAANAEQAAALVKALNEAGELLGVTILVRENNVPVSGVTVTLSSGSDQTFPSGRVAAVLTATTGADGNAVFDKVQIGFNTVSLTKAGLATATARLNFGTPDAPQAVTTTINGVTKTTYLPPVKRFEAVALPMFSKSGGSSATIRGRVTIESDVTNLTPEAPPAGTPILADFTALTNSTVVTGTNAGIVSNFVLDDANLGTAVTDAAGNYTLTVPATVAGYTVNLIFPTLELNQTIAVAKLDGKDINPDGSPVVRSVSTIFGAPSAPTNTFTAIPNYPGAKAVFPAAPATGRGLKVNYTVVPRALQAEFGLWTYGDDDQWDAGATEYRFTSRGNHTSSPTITITGGGATTNAKMRASLRGTLTSLALTAGGTGYNGSNVTVTIRYKDTDNNTVTALDNNANIAQFSAPVTVSAGAIASISFPTDYLTNYYPGLNPQNPFITSMNGASGFKVANFEVVISGGGGTGATATGTFKSEVHRVELTDGGAGYTSAPTIVFGANGANDAKLSITQFYSQWFVSLDNSSNTVPYAVAPSNIQYNSFNNNNSTNVWTDLEDSFGNTDNFIDLVTVLNGQVVFKNPSLTFKTEKFGMMPSTIITDALSVNAFAFPVVDATGKVTGLSNTSTGAVANPITAANRGDGYSNRLTVSIVPTIGTAGTGAAFDLGNSFSFNSNSKEYQWNGGYTLLNGGTGYAQQANQQNVAPTNAGVYNNSGLVAGPSVKVGQTYTFNFNYGTGYKKENVQ